VDPKHTQALEQRLRKLETSELVEMLGPDRDGWQPEAIRIAEEQLRTRGVSEDIIEGLRVWKEHVATVEAQEHRRAMDLLFKTIHRDEPASDCHVCGAAESTVVVSFGLAAVVQDDRDLDIGATTLLSALTVPLLGAAVWMSSGRSRHDVLRLKLRLCATCSSQKKWLGGLDLTEGDYRLHPVYGLAEAIGFDRLVTADQLRDET
jgi:hypothetical protein